AQLTPRQGGGIALGQHAQLGTVDLEAIAGDLDRPRVVAEDRVVLEQVPERLGIGEVVDGDPLDVGPLLLRGAEHVAADATETVDPDPYGHAFVPLLYDVRKRARRPALPALGGPDPGAQQAISAVRVAGALSGPTARCRPRPRRAGRRGRAGTRRSTAGRSAGACRA